MVRFASSDTVPGLNYRSAGADGRHCGLRTGNPDPQIEILIRPLHSTQTTYVAVHFQKSLVVVVSF